CRSHSAQSLSDACSWSPAVSLAGPGRRGNACALCQTEEPRARPMRPGDPLCDDRQRSVALALIFETVLLYEDPVGAATPRSPQCRAGLPDNPSISPFVEAGCQYPHATAHGGPRAAMRTLLQIIGKSSDQQIATEAQRWSSAVQLAPGQPQLRCRSIEQAGN